MILYEIQDRATPALKAFLRSIPPNRSYFAGLGRALERLLRDHFRRKGAKPNKRGWPKSHFWDRRIRNATALTTITPTGATVTIADPAFAAHYHGATIRPKEKKALAIPLIPEAYGVMPSSGLIEGLFVFKPRDSDYAFLARDHPTIDRLQYVYLLTKKVTIPKDPDALPPTETINQTLIRQTTDWISRQKK